jgi:hypothetical protein
MVKKSEIETLSYIETGAFDYGPLKNSLTELEEATNENAEEITALAKRQTFTLSMMIDTAGEHVLVRGGKHPRMKMIHGYAIVCDGIEIDAYVEIQGAASRIKFYNGDKYGKGRIFDPFKNHAIHFSETVMVSLTVDRRILVSATFESTEEE